MPVMSPQRAFSNSKHTVLSDDEKKKVDDICGKIDEAIVGSFHGLTVRVNIPPVTVPMIGHILRRYAKVRDEDGSRWQVVAEPLDGAVGKAADLITAGAPCPWRIVLTPEWGR